MHLRFKQWKDREDRLSIGVVEEADKPQHRDDRPLVIAARRGGLVVENGGRGEHEVWCSVSVAYTTNPANFLANLHPSLGFSKRARVPERILNKRGDCERFLPAALASPDMLFGRILRGFSYVART